MSGLIQIRRVQDHLSHPGMRNSVSVALAKGSMMAARTALLLWVAYRAGPIIFGKFALCVSTTEILRTACDFGTQTLFVRRFAQARELVKTQEELVAMAQFRAVATLLGLILYFFAISLIFRGKIGSVELLTSGLLVTALASSLPLTFYQAKLDTHKAVVPVIGSVFGYAIYCIVFRDYSIDVLIAGLIGYELFTACFLTMLVLREVGLPFHALIFKRPSESLRDTSKESYPIMGGALISTVYTRVDVYAVKAIAGVVALGLYSYAFRITEPFRYLALSIESSIYSHLSGKFSSAEERRPNFKLVEKLVYAYSLLFALFAYGVGIVVTAILYPEYAKTGSTILILSMALFFRCVNGYQTALQNALGNFHLTAQFSFIGLIATGILIYPLTKYFGSLGAAMTLLVMEIVNFLVQRHFYNAVVGPMKRGVA